MRAEARDVEPGRNGGDGRVHRRGRSRGGVRHRQRRGGNGRNGLGRRLDRVGEEEFLLILVAAATHRIDAPADQQNGDTGGTGDRQ
ncbi:hypothetical protein ACFSTI_19320 [Rhizorhabdus histidinilytica]